MCRQSYLTQGARSFRTATTGPPTAAASLRLGEGGKVALADGVEGGVGRPEHADERRVEDIITLPPGLAFSGSICICICCSSYCFRGDAATAGPGGRGEELEQVRAEGQDARVVSAQHGMRMRMRMRMGLKLLVRMSCWG